MSNLDALIQKYYDKFVGLPNNKPIVRQNQVDDAFEILVLEILYGKEKGIAVSQMQESDVTTLAKYIVAPPDDGIDLVVEREEIDGSSYDFVQVKNKSCTQLDIQQALIYMEKTIAKYLKKPTDINQNLREALYNSNFSSSDKKNCRYILVHRGEINFFKGQNEGVEKVISGPELEIIMEGINSSVPRVKIESFGADSFNNFSLYEEAEGNPAILMNICGYDLARLANKYGNTSLGRNILFGQNLREALSKSKTYDGMANTIRKEPEKFWFYNNGITIIAEDYNVTRENGNGEVDKLVLKDFSIINGAQTTSALGKFLKEAEMNLCEDDIDRLKRVFVLARILKVTNDDFKSQIAIFNNTQNPITTRDMASNRDEQLRLFRRLLDGAVPHIYVEIRNGMKAPSEVKLYKHQYTSNVELAQLSYAGFYRDPFTAKDKKNAIFDTDYKQTEGFLLNEYYHRLFNFSSDDDQKGILFKKQKEEINELLFVNYLFKLSKNDLIAEYKSRILDANTQLDECADESKRSGIISKINDYERLKAITNICVFYCLSYYYGFKEEFPNADKNKTYQYSRFYSDKEYQSQLVRDFRNLFLAGTVKIIGELAENSPNLNTWIRDKKSTGLFNEKVKKSLQLDLELDSKYKSYVASNKK